MSKNNFARRIRKIRKARGMSVQDLADKSGVFRQSIYTYEDGRTMPSLRAVTKLAKGLGVTVAALTRVAKVTA